LGGGTAAGHKEDWSGLAPVALAHRTGRIARRQARVEVVAAGAARCSSYGPLLDVETHGRRGFRVAAMVRVPETLLWPYSRARPDGLGICMGIKEMCMVRGEEQRGYWTDRQRSTTLPRVSPAYPSPANRNKQPHGTMSLSSMRPLVPIGLGYRGSVASRQTVSLIVEELPGASRIAAASRRLDFLDAIAVGVAGTI